MTKTLTETQRIAQELGMAESSIRSRRSRGTWLEAPPTRRLSRREIWEIGRRTRFTVAQLAEKYNCSASTVKRIRRLYRAKRLAKMQG